MEMIKTAYSLLLCYTFVSPGHCDHQKSLFYKASCVFIAEDKIELFLV